MSRKSKLYARYQGQPWRLLAHDTSVLFVCLLGAIEVVFAFAMFDCGCAYASFVRNWRGLNLPMSNADQFPITLFPPMETTNQDEAHHETTVVTKVRDISIIANFEAIFFKHMYETICIMAGGIGMMCGLAAIGGVYMGNRCMVATHFATSFVSMLGCGMVFLSSAFLITQFDHSFPNAKASGVKVKYEKWQQGLVWTNVFCSMIIALCCFFSTCLVCNLWSDGMVTHTEMSDGSQQQQLLPKWVPDPDKQPKSGRSPVPPPPESVPLPSEVDD